MSNKTPSGRRKAGREAFNPNTGPMDVQPYKPGSWAYMMDLQDWLEGWKEAENKYLAEKSKYTAKDAQQLRKDTGCSLAEAVVTLKKKELLTAIKDAQVYSELKPVLIWLLETI